MRQDPSITRAKSALRAKKSRLKRAYNLTLDQYDSMVLRQNGLCAICEKKPIGSYKLANILGVDHNHSTGEVRALLCRDCNIALGLIKDNPYIAFKMYLYIKGFSDYAKWFDGKA